mgnify:CR=1 FL=1
MNLRPRSSRIAAAVCTWIGVVLVIGLIVGMLVLGGYREWRIWWR